MCCLKLYFVRKKIDREVFFIKKLLCFDMDGTINIGNKLIDGTSETFRYINQLNIDYIFITNNSSKNVNSYINKIQKLGIKCSKKNFFTSIEVTRLYLLKNNIKNIYLIGTKDFYNELIKDFNILSEYQKNNCDCVVVGFDTELNYEKLKIASKYLEDGVNFIATNPDLRCPIEDNRYIPDCGAICHMLEDTTNRKPIFLGKPNGEMITYLCEREKVDLNDAMVIGDRLYTDILVGINAGVDTVAVLTGETTIEEINDSEYKPTYIINSIKDLPNILEGDKNV